MKAFLWMIIFLVGLVSPGLADITCPQCGYDNGDNDRYCLECAAEIRSQTPEEKKKVTRQIPASGKTFETDSITVDFKDQDIRNVIRIMEHEYKLTIPYPATMRGSITLKRYDTPAILILKQCLHKVNHELIPWHSSYKVIPQKS